MTPCVLKGTFIFICICIALSGLYLAFTRERININAGTPDRQEGGGNIREGTFTFNFAIGIVLIVVGLLGGYYSIINLPGCDNADQSKIPGNQSKVSDNQSKSPDNQSETTEDKSKAAESQSKDSRNQKMPSGRFLMTPNGSVFAIVASSQGDYSVDGNFIQGNTQKTTITFRSNHEKGKYNGKMYVFALRYAIARYLPDGSWKIEQYSEKVPIERFLSPGETFTTSLIQFVIPTRGINNLPGCHMLIEITASDSTKNTARTGFSYAHDVQNIHY